MLYLIITTTLIKQFINFSIMLDLRFIRENTWLIKENLKKRFKGNLIQVVDEIAEDYGSWTKLKKTLDDLKHKRNIISNGINSLKRQNKDASGQITLAKALPQEIKDLEETVKRLREKIWENQLKIPNIISASVPIGKDESENKVLRKVGAKTKLSFKPKTHVELIEKLGVGDFESSTKTSGNGFYILKGKLAVLNQALIRFAIDHMLKKRYSYIEPPLMLKQSILSASADMETISNSIYKVENEDLDLIGTSEYSLLGMHTDETINEEDLPKKYFAYTMCFRKEIGSHGINEKGLWRTHQFNKVEQFIFCKPEDSDRYYEELLKNSEEIFKKLKLPYRVIEMCSGDLAKWKAKSADIEAYRPTINNYGEVGSLSNCTSYQARKLNIKLLRKDGTREALHTLNNTVIATSRVMVAILENYQKKDGTIKIPAVLQKYTGFNKIAKENE